MKTSTFIILLTAMCVIMAMGCESLNDASNVSRDTTTEIAEVPIGRMGELHNEVLTLSYEFLLEAVGPGPTSLNSIATTAERYKAAFAGATTEQKNQAAFKAANQILARENKPLATMSEVERYTEMGRELARNVEGSDHQTPDKIAWMALDGETQRDGVPSFDYYSQWVSLKAGGPSARDAYAQVIQNLGEPIPWSKLAMFFDVLLHSDDFWSAQYPDGGPALVGGSGDTGPQLGWGKVWRFITLTVVDAGSGLLTGAGYGSIGGPGGTIAGSVVGAVVGGLSSWGANDIIYN